VAADALRAWAVLAGGLFAGFLLTSVIRVPPATRFRTFMICGFTGSLCLVGVALTDRFSLMIALLALGGGMTAVLNRFIPAVIQMSTPPDMRGKIFALLGAISQGATPIAMALAGILAEFLPLRVLMASCFGAVFISFVPFLTSSWIRSFLNTEPRVSPIQGEIEGPWSHRSA
jgi:MFS transporter, DHA3 family, macrolide efflux protein